MSRRLLAIDLDGTLLRLPGNAAGAPGAPDSPWSEILPADAIDARDRAAIHRARRAGVLVTLATGRMVRGALPAARALALDVPLVCADGAALACPRTGAVLAGADIEPDLALACLDALSAHGLVPFVFLHDAIHCGEDGRAYARWLASWTPRLVIHARLAAARAWQTRGRIACLLGIGVDMAVGSGGGPGGGAGTGGHESAAASMHHALAACARARGAQLATSTFPMDTHGTWAVRASPRGHDKGTGLARLAARLGVARARVAAVGDWWNDLTMFAWAGRSFAMGHAPPEVQAAATDVLLSTAETGGGVAEAIDRWLGQ